MHVHVTRTGHGDSKVRGPKFGRRFPHSDSDGGKSLGKKIAGKKSRIAHDWLVAQTGYRPTSAHTLQNAVFCIVPFSHSTTDRMAALVKAVNAKIRSNPVLDYVCSTRE